MAKIGFVNVQFHGATAVADAHCPTVSVRTLHGRVGAQFLSGHSNQRSDEWGGDAMRRRRFVLEVYREIRERTGPGFPIGIKMNSADFQKGGFTEEESLDVVRALSEAGIDMIEISGGTYEAPVMAGVSAKPVKESTRRREAYFLEFAEKARSATKTPLMVTGGFRSVARMNDAIASGAVDFVGLARLLAIEPDAPKRLLAGLEPRNAVKPIRTGIGAVDRMALLEVTWYGRQLRRIGAGRDPKPRIGALGACGKWRYCSPIFPRVSLCTMQSPLPRAVTCDVQLQPSAWGVSDVPLFRANHHDRLPARATGLLPDLGRRGGPALANWPRG